MLLYITVMLKPLLPIVNDWWSHEFNQIEHVSLIHAKYGSRHVTKELADRAYENGSTKNQNTLKLQDQVQLHISVVKCTSPFSLNSFQIDYPVLKLYKLPAIFISKQGPPPKFS